MFFNVQNLRVSLDGSIKSESLAVLRIILDLPFCHLSALLFIFFLH